MSKVMFLISPSLNALTDPRKGTSGNKIDCAGHHFANSLRSNVEIAAVAGATAFVGRGIVKSAAKKAAAAAAAAALKVAETAAAAPKVAETVAAAVTKKPNYLKKFVEYFEAAPGWMKKGAFALMGLSLLVRTYRKGKIEQKYEDRAQFVDNTFKREQVGSAPVKPAK